MSCFSDVQSRTCSNCFVTCPRSWPLRGHSFGYGERLPSAYRGKTMDKEGIVREQLLDLLRGGNAHMDFDQAVDQFPPPYFNSQPPNSDYTPWRLLEHMRIAQWDILEFIRNPNHVSPAWPEGYWPPQGEKADRKKWERTIRTFRVDLQTMKGIVENPNTSLLAPLAHAEGYTMLREVLVLADHNSYHIGEFAILRQIMGTWPKE